MKSCRIQLQRRGFEPRKEESYEGKVTQKCVSFHPHSFPPSNWLSLLLFPLVLLVLIFGLDLYYSVQLILQRFSFNTTLHWDPLIVFWWTPTSSISQSRIKWVASFCFYSFLFGNVCCGNICFLLLSKQTIVLVLHI